MKFVAKSHAYENQLFEAVERAYIELPVSDWDAFVNSMLCLNPTSTNPGSMSARPEPNEALKSGFRWYRNIKNS